MQGPKEAEAIMAEEQTTLEAAHEAAANSGAAELMLEGSLATRFVELAEAEPEDEPGRRKRRTRSRARTISIRRLSKTELNRGREQFPEVDYWRPQTRGDCMEMERPCPFVACKYHLYIDVHPVRGSIKINFPDVEVWEMTDTCALDIADRGGITLEEVGQIMNLTRERVRQLETQGLARLQRVDGVERLRDYVAL
jgi:hypothetical protein